MRANRGQLDKSGQAEIHRIPSIVPEDLKAPIVSTHHPPYLVVGFLANLVDRFVRQAGDENPHRRFLGTLHPRCFPSAERIWTRAPLLRITFMWFVTACR